MLKLLVLLAIVIALAFGVATQPATAQEQGSWAEDWLFETELETLRGESVNISYQRVCIVYVQQDGSELSGALACTGFQNASFAGRTRDDGSFTITMSQRDNTLQISGELTEFGLQGSYEVTDSLNQSLSGGVVAGQPWGALWGDMNCDAAVNSMDAFYILSNSSELCPDLGSIPTTPVPNFSALGGDGNVDNVIDSRDALLILQVDAGLIPRLPVL